MLFRSNLRQIGIASHNYHGDFSKLPPGFYGPVKSFGATNIDPTPNINRGPWVGCLVPLLPYMEQDSLFKMLYTTPRTNPPPVDMAIQGWNCGLNEERQAWWSTTLNRTISTGQVKVKMLKCPSDTVDETVAVGVFLTISCNASNTNGTFYGVVDGQDILGRTNYTGVAGAAGDFDTGVNAVWNGMDFRQWIGIMYNRSTLTLGQVTVQDGTSNTLLFGESLGGTGMGARDTAWSWFGVGALGTAFGLGNSRVPIPPVTTGAGTKIPPQQYGDPITNLPPNTDGASWYRFSSRHAAVVQFCFGDCSTRGVRFGSTTAPNNTTSGGQPPPTPGNNTSDWAVLQQMAGRKDGFTANISGITE